MVSGHAVASVSVGILENLDFNLCSFGNGSMQCGMVVSSSSALVGDHWGP